MASILANPTKKTFLFALIASLLIGLAAGFAFGNVSVAAADSVFRIEVGDSNSGGRGGDRDLKRRVWELERAVAQLQERVFQLSQSEASKPAAAGWTCYISAFGNTYTHTANTQTAAKAEVMSRCAKENSAMHCSDRNVTCGQ